jgi:hypothetical protein
MQWNEFDESIPKQIEKMINLVPEEDLSKYPEIKHETKEERKRKMKEATELK